jgi:hypothetical protein
MIFIISDADFSHFDPVRATPNFEWIITPIYHVKHYHYVTYEKESLPGQIEEGIR